jgi:hypothetical protein
LLCAARRLRPVLMAEHSTRIEGGQLMTMSFERYALAVITRPMVFDVIAESMSADGRPELPDMARIRLGLMAYRGEIKRRSFSWRGKRIEVYAPMDCPMSRCEAELWSGLALRRDGGQ